MADAGNVFDAIFKPEWLALVHGVEALATNAEGEVKTGLQAAQSEVAAGLASAATTVTAAQGKVQATLDPLVNQGISALGSALSHAYPPIAPLVAASEAEAEKLADAGTDALINATITRLAAFLSNAGKTVAAVNLGNIAGAS